MNQMFMNCLSLKTIYVSSSWNTNNVTSSNIMFAGCTSLIGGKGTIFSYDYSLDKTMAIIDGTNGQPGYLTDIADKPNN